MPAHQSPLLYGDQPTEWVVGRKQIHIRGFTQLRQIINHHPLTYDWRSYRFVYFIKLSNCFPFCYYNDYYISIDCTGLGKITRDKMEHDNTRLNVNLVNNDFFFLFPPLSWITQGMATLHKNKGVCSKCNTLWSAKLSAVVITTIFKACLIHICIPDW